MKLINTIKTNHCLITIFSITLCIFSVVLLCPNKVQAAFDANFIISDAEMSAYQTMSEAQIQTFLNANNSYLKNYTETRSNLMGDPERYQAQYKSAAHIIWWVSQEYKINPQVILATLQKEQSLITTTYLNQYGLDWAMGYAVPDSGERDYNKIGFSRQVDWGGYQLKWNMNKANEKNSKVCYTYPWEPYSPSFSGNQYCYWTGNLVPIDNTLVYLGNGATASLYRYTPHFHGNQLFYTNYTMWFSFGEYVSSVLRVSTSLTLSNNTPAIGELVKATASVQNTSSAPITLQYLGIVNYFGSYARNFGGGAITLNPGQIVSLTDYPERTLPDLGSYKAWVCFAYADRWYTVTPASGKISEITYNTHIPDIRIVGYIDLNPASPVAGQSVTATASIRNMEAKSIKLDAVAIANILNYPQQNYRSFGGETMTIPAGEARLLQYSRTLTETGTYRASIAFATGNYWFEVPWSGKMYVVNHPLSVLRVSTSLTLSNNTPAIGELVKATASVQNTSSAPITLQYLGIVNYFGSYARNFGGGAITLNPGQIVSLTDYPERTLPDLGSYKAWVCFAYADRWYTVTPASGKISEITYNTHIPDIRIVGYIDLNPASPVAGQSVTATASIRNMEAKSIKLDAVAIANILNYPQQNYRSFGGETMTIPAGEARLLQYSRTLTETGTYRASIAFATGNYWFEVPWSGKMYVVR